jgi:hypothetical protein
MSAPKREKSPSAPPDTFTYGGVHFWRGEPQARLVNDLLGLWSLDWQTYQAESEKHQAPSPGTDRPTTPSNGQGGPGG